MYGPNQVRFRILCWNQRPCTLVLSQEAKLFSFSEHVWRCAASQRRLVDSHGPRGAHFTFGENDPIGMHRAMIIRRFHRNRSRLLLHVQNPQFLLTSFLFTHPRISILIL